MCPFLWDPVIGCDGVEYANSCVAEVSGVTSWTNAAGLVNTLDWDCGQNSDDCVCPEIYDPVCGNDGVTYSNSCFLACAGVGVYESGECENNVALCTSYSGIEIYESGDWANPNNPCDFGFCAEDGFFSGVIIDWQNKWVRHVMVNGC